MERNIGSRGVSPRGTNRLLTMAATTTVAALLAAACGSDGPARLSQDDLASEADSICRSAARELDDLDEDDEAERLDETVQLIGDAADELELLVPPADLADDFDDLTSSLTQQVRHLRRLAAAVRGGDSAGIDAELEELADLAEESDELADDLDARRCVGLTQAATEGLGAGATTTTTAPSGPTTVETTAPPTSTTPPVTVPPITTSPPTVATLPPITTAPPTTPTSPPDDGDPADGNMADTWTAPPGYTWEREAGDIFVSIFQSPRDVPAIAPFYVRYEVGALANDAISSFPVLLALELSTPFTADEIAPYLAFEGNSQGSTFDSPAGYKMWLSPAAEGETFASTVVFLGRYAVTLRHEPGFDGVSLLDAFIDINFE